MIKLTQLLFEAEEEERKILVSFTKEGVLVMCDNPRSSATISKMDNNIWYVNRVIVGDSKDPSTKGKGIGSMLLRRALAEILNRDPQAKIIVEPGGYDLRKLPDQINFYAKNGFVKIPGKEGAMIFNNPKMKKES